MQILNLKNYKGHELVVVRIGENSKYYGQHYDNIPVSCHGGLTFADVLFDRGWYIGFDCNHYGDTLEVCNIDFCVNECKDIINQLISLEKGGLN